MKIIQIGSYPKNSRFIRGGVEASIFGLAKTQSLNHDIHVLDFPDSFIDKDYEERCLDVNVYRFRQPGKHNISSLQRVGDYYLKIKEISPDVCHLHGSSIFVRQLYRLLRKNGYRCVVTIHGLVHVEKHKALKNGFKLKLFIQYLIQSFNEFRLIDNSNLLIVDTEYVKNEIEAYRQSHKVLKMPDIRVIPQGIDEAFFNLKLIKTNDEINLLSVGAFVERKGHHQLIKAFAKFNQDNQDNISFKLRIIGTLTDKLYHAKLLDLIRHERLVDKVLLLTNVDKVDLHSYYQQADLFVLHSLEESQGIVFAEAMAVGLPIVSTNAGGIPNVVKHERNGLLSDFQDVEAYVCNLRKLVNDKNYALQISANNINDAKFYSWEKIARDIELVYEQL